MAEVRGPGAVARLKDLLGPVVGVRHSPAAYRRAAVALVTGREAKPSRVQRSSERSARACLERRSLKILRRVVEAGGPDAVSRLAELLGPRVSARHPPGDFREAARALVAEREAARARRLGEVLLSVEEQARLAAAGSRLLGLGDSGSPLGDVSDAALESVRVEPDLGRLAGRLDELDPQGEWTQVPQVGLFRGLVLVAVSSEQERRWRRKEARNLARTRGRRTRPASSPPR